MNSARPSAPKDEGYETFQKEENMRNDLTATDGGTCQKHHLAGRKRRAAECNSQKTYYGAKRCRNAFLRHKFPCIKSEISMHGATTTGEEINYITQENYEFLRDSYFRYAALMGEPAPHNPGRSPGEGISNLYYEMAELLDSELGVNFEYSRDKICFTLWKHHRWDTDILYWLPVKFVEALPEELQRIAITFLHDFRQKHHLPTTNDSDDFDYIFDMQEEFAGNNPDASESKESMELLTAYKSGHIHRLMESIETKSYYENLPAALDRYEPQNDAERELIDLMRKGLLFIQKDAPSIMDFAYDPEREEEPEFWPLELYQQIRYVYDYDDEISNNLMEWFNQNREVSYEISPVTTLELSPMTEQLFGATDYPERFRKWLEDFIWFVSDFTAEENTDNASAPVPISVPYGDFTLIGNNTNTQLQTA